MKGVASADHRVARFIVGGLVAQAVAGFMFGAFQVTGGLLYGWLGIIGAIAGTAYLVIGAYMMIVYTSRFFREAHYTAVREMRSHEAPTLHVSVPTQRHR